MTRKQMLSLSSPNVVSQHLGYTGRSWIWKISRKDVMTCYSLLRLSVALPSAGANVIRSNGVNDAAQSSLWRFDSWLMEPGSMQCGFWFSKNWNLEMVTLRTFDMYLFRCLGCYFGIFWWFTLMILRYFKQSYLNRAPRGRRTVAAWVPRMQLDANSGAH